MTNFLPKRLLAVARYVKNNDSVADIGSDHGYLPIYLAKNYMLKGLYASDNKKGPYRRLLKNVVDAGLENSIICDLADGLEHLPASIDTLVIAGMGGEQIIDILSNDADKLKNIKKILLIPHVQAKEVRQALNQWHFMIKAEEIVEEDGHFYSLIIAEPGEEKLRIDQAIFGPRLLEHPSAAMYQMWNEQARKLQNLLNDYTLPAQRKIQVEQELQLINLLLRIEAPKND